MAFHGERRGRYTTATEVGRPFSDGDRPVLDRALSADEVAQLCKSIIEIFAEQKCYDAMGLSTQVVVVEVHAPLTVAFIAAQETKVPQCVLWDAQLRKFVGVLPTTEYIKILLYCHDNPQEKELVTQMTIWQWLQKSRQLYPSSSSPPLGQIVACDADDYLYQCLSQMVTHGVRRCLLVTEKEASDISLVGVMTHENLLKFLASKLFALDDAEDASATLGVSDSDDPNALPQGVKTIVEAPSPANVSSSGAATDLGDHEGVGPYRTILDVPFSQLTGLGAHRYQLNSVTMKTPVVDALRMLIDKKVHSVAVVDDHGIVIDVVSRNDVMRMETNGMYDVTMSVAEAISFHVGGQIFVFHETCTVRDILIQFAHSKVRELYLVDPLTDRLLGQLSMSEFLRFLLLGRLPSQ